MNQKHVFWEALLVSIFIFASGILLGYFIELNRTSKIIESYQQSELSLLDIGLEEEILSFEDIDCGDAESTLIDLANRVYEEAKVLQRYEDSSKISEGAIQQHKRYDILRAIIWVNAIKIKEKCGSDFHTLVYFYEYQTENKELTQIAKQEAFSRALLEAKENSGESVILIPIAGNLELSSIDLLKKRYEIDTLPLVIIDEETRIDNLESLKELGNYLK